MGTKHFHYLLGFLTLLGMVHGQGPQGVPVVGTGRAWVRAPDLAPNTVVQGDARVKISAECPDIDSVSLGLRFKERSFMKVLRSREDVKRLQHLSRHVAEMDFMGSSPWQSSSVNRTTQKEFEELLTNKDLWFVREEERTVFEMTQPFDIGTGNHGVLRDAIQEFTILVPFTNFPLAFEGSRFRAAGELETIDVEWIYEYFAQIKFFDGTIDEISAGRTSFQPDHDPLANGIQPNSTTVELKSYRFDGKPKGTKAIANYTVDISSESGLTFVAGKKNHVVDAVITRTGFPRTFLEPLNVRACITPKMSPKWAVEHGLSDDHSYQSVPASVLRTTSDGEHKVTFKNRRPARSAGNQATVTIPSSTPDEIQAGEIVTTKSEAFTIPIELDERHVSNFDTYYETLSNSLRIELQIPGPEFGEIDPDDPFGEPWSPTVDWGPMFEDDEEPWVPWDKSQRGLMPTGRLFIQHGENVPVVVHPPGEALPLQRCLASGTPVQDQVVLSDQNVREQLSPVTHYLDQGARAPIFVDRGAVDTLLAEDPTERNLRAPVLKPVVWSPPKGEELVHRYHRPDHPPWQGPMYVGETWAKKVVKKSAEVPCCDPPLHHMEPTPNHCL